MTAQAQPQTQSLKLGPFTLVLSGLALLAGASAITAELIDAPAMAYIAKPITLALIIIVALISYDPPSGFYKWTIIVGLIFSLAGDVLLMLPQDLFLFGLISFAVAQLFYTTAFIHDGGFYRNLRSAVPFLLFGVFMAALLWSDLGDMLLPAMAYLVIILVMAWQGFGYWRKHPGTRGKLLFIGVLLFVASDSFLAINRWLYDFENLAPILVLGTYYPAQWLIAQSAGRRHP